MKGGKSNTVVTHLIVWLLLSVAWFFSVESLLNIVAAGFSNVAMWLFAEIAGMVLIFIMMAILLLVQLRKR